MEVPANYEEHKLHQFHHYIPGKSEFGDNRYFNISTDKFNSKTGIKFKLNLRENIELMYNSIRDISL